MFYWTFFVLLVVTSVLGNPPNLYGQKPSYTSNWRSQPTVSFQEGTRSDVDDSQYYRRQPEPVTYNSRQFDNVPQYVQEPPYQPVAEPRGNLGRGIDRSGSFRRPRIEPVSTGPMNYQSQSSMSEYYPPQSPMRERAPPQVYDYQQRRAWPQQSRSQQFDYPQETRGLESFPSRGYGYSPRASEISPARSSMPYSGYVEPVQPRVDSSYRNQPPQDYNWRDYVRDNPPAAMTTNKWLTNGRASSKPQYANKREEDDFNFFENALKRDSFKKGTHGLSFESGDIEEVQADKKEHLVGQMAWAGGQVPKKEVARREAKYREDYGDIKPGATLGVDAFQIFAELMAGAGNNEEWWEKQRRDGEERHQEWKRQRGMMYY